MCFSICFRYVATGGVVLKFVFTYVATGDLVLNFSIILVYVFTGGIGVFVFLKFFDGYVATEGFGGFEFFDGYVATGGFGGFEFFVLVQVDFVFLKFV